MIPLTAVAHSHVRSALQAGDVAIDATVGNGHDTLFLAECVGPNGLVYGFDIQESALATTGERLRAAGQTNVELLHSSHSEMQTALPELPPGKLRAVMFNLGYLPGGDKSLTTQATSTNVAIQAALSLLAPGGIVTILAYVGHPGGEEEADGVESLITRLPAVEFELLQDPATIERTSAPRLFVIRKRG